MVKIQTVEYKSSIDGCVLHGDLYSPENPRAFIFLIHGMAEYRKRYSAYAEKLAGEAYQVLAMDLRGHGDSPCEGKYGYFGERKGVQRQLFDFVECLKQFNQKNLAIFIFGHSMGSLWARLILKNYPKLAHAYLLSGSPGKISSQDFTYSLLSSSASALSIFKPDKPAKLIAETLNKAFLKELENPLTKYDWLSYERENILAYSEDPRCGFPFTYSGYKDLAQLLEEVYGSAKWQVENPQTPIIFMAGGADPVAKVKSGALNAAVEDLKSKAYQNLRLRVYQQSRHEIFFDQQREQVWQDSFNFFNSVQI